MKTSLKKIFSLIDGRLSTEMNDVYVQLDWITGESLMTHSLGTANKYIKSLDLDWWKAIEARLDEIKALIGNDFEDLMEYIDTNYPEDDIELVELTSEQKVGFGPYMMENSALKNLGKNS